MPLRSTPRLMTTVILTTVVMACAVLCQAQERPAPAIRFTARGATIAGATPNGSAAVFGIGLKADGVWPVSFKWADVVACDNRGEATIDFGFDVPQSSIWAVVDGRTGQASLSTPGGVPVPAARLRPDFLRRRAGSVSEFAFDHPVLDLLYVEPSGGVWVGATQDGAKTDRDGPNGVSAISVADFHPLRGTSGAPAELKAGGCLIAVDVVRMEAVSIRLDQAMIGAAR